jgi:ABC-type protease/lipase transport system fused ATPase/permease subunit
MMTALMAGAGIACVGTSRGGSHNLTHALARCFVHHGGKLRFSDSSGSVIADQLDPQKYFEHIGE